MKFDKFDQFETESNSLRKKDGIKDLHLSFEGKSRHELGGPGSVSFDAFTNNIENWTSIQNLAFRPESIPEITNIIKQMKDGIIVNGKKTLGLLELGKRKLNPDYYYQNLKQQSGFAAEIIEIIVDLPTDGSPTKPTSAKSFNSTFTLTSSPGSPPSA